LALNRALRRMVGRLRLWNLEITTDLSGKKVIHLAMARNGRRLSGRSVYENRMLAALTKQDAIVLPKVPN